MKKLIRTIFVLVLSLVSFALFACEEDEKPVFSAEDAIKVLLVEQDTYVSSDFTVPAKLHYKGTDYQLSWTSDNACLAVSETANENGTYKITATRPDAGKQTATLTASLTVGETNATKSFTFNLYPIDVYEISDAYSFKYANKAIKESISLDSKSTYAGKEATITWAVDEASKDVISIENGKVVFEEPTAETPVKIWATFEYNGEQAKRPFNMTLIPSVVGPSIVSEFADGDTFKFGLYQEGLGKYLYITGEMNGYYFATTEDGSAAADVTVHVVDGGYQLTVNGKYIEILVSGSHNNVVFSDTPSVVWQWDATLNTFTLDIVNEANASKTGINMLGTSGTYNTLSANLTSKEDAYVAHLYQLPYGPLANPVAGQSYKFGFYQAEDGKDLFLTGEMSGYYGATTDDVNAAIDVTIEETTGGYYLTIMKNGTKQYISLVGSGNYTNFKFLDAAPTTVWTWNEEYHTFVMDVVNPDNAAKSGVYFLGTYGSNKTFGASAISYATNPTNYIAHMYAPGASLPTTPEGGDNGNTDGGNTEETGIVVVTSPAVDTEYYLRLNQTAKNEPYYFTGTMSGYYGASSTNPESAVKVKLTAVTGGYNVSFVVGGATKYINAEVSGTHLNFVIGDAAATVWTWNTELNALVTVLGEETVFIGTYSNYVTFGVSAISKAESSYVAQLYTVGTGSGSTEPTPTPTPTPTPSSSNRADLETMGAASASYAAHTSTNGWVVENSALNAGGTNDVNPNFKVFGTADDRAVTLNGKVTAPGKLTSPVLTGGISKLTFNYCQLFTDKSFSATVSIKDAEGNVLASKVLEFTSGGTTDDKYIVYEFVFELETPVTGDFQIEIVNNCPTQASGNKDRLSIWNISWVSAE